MPLNNPATAGPTHQQIVTESRSLGAVYQNNTGVPLYVALDAICYASAPAECAKLRLYNDGSNPPTTTLTFDGIHYGVASNPQLVVSLFFVVLPGNYYKVSPIISGGAEVTLDRWVEWY